ncbi:micrococcal nuclease [Cryobacterium sp. MP_M5]|uniref:thermonuclease family protein n=1 Tax=unclassified Cryobacterium TaxID=2649013 RepID=UPI0018CBF0B8|nr:MULTISPECIES: thermonuclease family protein [unclassified Cryobacterium]MBG6058394.1 endonuclease YncB(thermonuclease family) [Cryobacterium sp. MP_M3]MEC5176954.1 micrococcal nuclease [Cryobacterium sp. MP_M5]
MVRTMLRGAGLLLAVVAVGALGLLAFQPGGPLGSLVDVTGRGTTVAPSVQSDAAGTAPAGVPARPVGAVAMTVEHVHDGDTLFLRADQPNALVPSTDAVKVRLIGIDTPEVGDGAECYGDEATLALRALVPDGSTVWITADREPTDRFGRSLFYLWSDDGRFVNYELVEDGAAESLVIPPNDAYYPLLRAAEDAATTAGSGMWGAC